MCGLNFFQMTVRQCTYHIYVPGTIYYIVCGFVKILCVVLVKYMYDVQVHVLK